MKESSKRPFAPVDAVYQKKQKKQSSGHLWEARGVKLS